MAAQPDAGAVLFAKDMRRIADFYEAVANLQVRVRERDHIVLESRTFQLLVHAVPRHIAEGIHVEAPPKPRENTSIKLVLFVDSIEAARAGALRMHGMLKGVDAEWQFEGSVVCDGYDPEGNVFQLRQPLVR